MAEGSLGCSATEWETAGERRRSAGVQAEELIEVELHAVQAGGTAQMQWPETGGDCAGSCLGQERRLPGDVLGRGTGPEKVWGRTALIALLPRSSAPQPQCKGPQGGSATHARLGGTFAPEHGIPTHQLQATNMPEFRSFFPSNAVGKTSYRVLQLRGVATQRGCVRH